MIEVKNLTKSLPNGRKLLDGISFTVNKGEFVGILGPSGAGKTLTLRCLNGLLKPDRGSVIVEDENQVRRDICSVPKRQLRRLRQKIGVVFQGYHLVKRLTGLENVLIGRLGQINTLRSLLYGFTDLEAEQALLALDKVKIGHLAGTRVGSMSGGEMQRVAIARAIFQDPTLLLADEPISNLDPSNAKTIMKLIRPLSATMPVIGVFHQPEMTARYCSRVIAIKDGKIIYDGDPRLSMDLLIEIYGEELRQLENHEQPLAERISAASMTDPVSFPEGRVQIAGELIANTPGPIAGDLLATPPGQIAGDPGQIAGIPPQAAADSYEQDRLLGEHVLKNMGAAMRLKQNEVKVLKDIYALKKPEQP